MKKKILIIWIIVILCLIGLIVLLQQCNHEDLTTFTMAAVSEITFEELLSPPYVTVGDWSFVDLWTVRCGGQSTDASIAEKGSAQKIGEALRELLIGEMLYTYIPAEKVYNYDKHVKELLWEQNYYHTYLQLIAQSNPSVEISNDDVKLHMIHLYVLDASQGYLTVSYRTGGEPESKAYVFSINDPVTISHLVSFAAEIAYQYPTEPDPTEPFREGNTAMPPSVFINDKLYVGADYPSGYSEISKDCVYVGEITECVGANNVPEKNFQANYSPVGTKVYQYHSVILLEEESKYYAYVEEQKTLDYFDYNDKVQVSFCQWSYEEETGNLEQKITNITLTAEEKHHLLELLDPYCGMTTTGDVLKMELSKYYCIEVDGKWSVMTVNIDAEGGNYGEGDDFYMSVMEHHPMAFLEATYVNKDLVNFLDEQLKEVIQ